MEFFSMIIDKLNTDMSMRDYRNMSGALFALLDCIRKDKRVLLTHSFLSLLASLLSLFFRTNYLIPIRSKYCEYCNPFRDYLEIKFKAYFNQKYKLLYPLSERIVNACIDTECAF